MDEEDFFKRAGRTVGNGLLKVVAKILGFVLFFVLAIPLVLWLDKSPSVVHPESGDPTEITPAESENPSPEQCAVIRMVLSARIDTMSARKRFYADIYNRCGCGVDTLSGSEDEQEEEHHAHGHEEAPEEKTDEPPKKAAREGPIRYAYGARSWARSNLHAESSGPMFSTAYPSPAQEASSAHQVRKTFIQWLETAEPSGRPKYEPTPKPNERPVVPRTPPRR